MTKWPQLKLPRDELTNIPSGIVVRAVLSFTKYRSQQHNGVLTTDNDELTRQHCKLTGHKDFLTDHYCM